MSKRRTELHREIVEALIESNAVNLEAIGSVFAKYGARAALAGDAIGIVINWRLWDICIPPFYVDQIESLEGEATVATELKR